MKGNIKREGGQDRGKLRGEELWIPKEEEKSSQKEQTIVNRGDRKCTKSIYVRGRETASDMGCVNQGWERARRVLRWCVGAKGSLDSGKGDLKRRSGKAVRCERGDGDRAGDVLEANV